MAAYTLKGRVAAPTYEAPGMATIKQTIDLPALIAKPSDLALAASPNLGLTSFSGLVNADTLKAILIPAGFVVLNVCLRVRVAEGEACTIGVGDSGSATQFLTTASLNSAAVVLGANSVLKAYNADDYVLVTCNTAVTYNVAKFEIAVLGAFIGV